MDSLIEDDIKQCPYCAEIIKAEAIKCKHCGENLIEEDFWTESDRKKRERQAQTPTPPKINSGTAAVLSLFFPGAGQIYRGKIGKGIFWFIIVLIGYFPFIFPGLILQVICIYNAYNSE